MLIKLLTCIGLFTKVDHTRSSAVKKASKPHTPTEKFKTINTLMSLVLLTKGNSFGIICCAVSHLPNMKEQR